MKKNIFVLFFVILSIFTSKVYAENSAIPSAVLVDARSLSLSDNRVKILKEFLGSYNSPLAPLAQVFVENADIYNLDWRLVAAISGVESTFGQQIPAGSYNAWGWGVYGNHVTYFTSWTNGIEIISKGLRENYIGQGNQENVYQIGATYAASPAWVFHVEYYMNRINDFTLLNPQDSLSISL